MRNAEVKVGGSTKRDEIDWVHRKRAVVIARTSKFTRHCDRSGMVSMIKFTGSFDDNLIDVLYPTSF